MAKKAFWIAFYRSIKDPEKFAAYAKVAPAAIQASGGRFIARGGVAKTYESGMNERVVMIEFDSLAQAVAAHDTPAYQDALKALGDGADRDIRIVEAIDAPPG